MPEVQQALFGRHAEMTPDSLPGWRLEWIDVADPAVVAKSGLTSHPILRRGSVADTVDGVALMLDDAELAAVDAYEVPDYVRVEVTLASGVQAWVYVAAD